MVPKCCYIWCATLFFKSRDNAFVQNRRNSLPCTDRRVGCLLDVTEKEILSTHSFSWMKWTWLEIFLIRQLIKNIMGESISYRFCNNKENIIKFRNLNKKCLIIINVFLDLIYFSKLFSQVICTFYVESIMYFR